MLNIEIKLGDITTAQVDAIVNAANPAMLGGGGVDGAIHRAAGPGLLEACRQVTAVNGTRCPSGEARITEAGSLNAKYVIHTVGPVYYYDDNPARTLENAYTSACELALENACASVAFPAISCGAFGYPHEAAARIALTVCASPRYSQLKICFFLFEQELYEVFQRVHKNLFG